MKKDRRQRLETTSAASPAIIVICRPEMGMLMA